MLVIYRFLAIVVFLFFQTATNAWPRDPFDLIRQIQKPTVTVQIVNTQLECLLDTGSTNTVVYKHRAEILGNPIRTQRSVVHLGTAEIQFFPPGTVKPIGGDPVTLPLFSVDASRMNAGCDVPIDGILGMDYLANHAIELNVLKRISRISSKTTKLIPTEDMSSFPLRLDKAPVRPSIRVDILGYEEPIQCSFDTAAEFSFQVTPKVMNSLLRTGFAVETPGSKGTTLYGDVNVRRAVVREIVVFGTKLQNVICSEDQRMNVIGIDLLSRFHVIMDIPNHQYWVKREAARPLDHWMDLENFVGLGIIKSKHGTYQIEGMRGGSEAERVGLKAGDEVVSINGEPMSRVTLAGARMLFRDRGTVVRLQVRRDGEVRQFTMNVEYHFKYPPAWPPLPPQLPDF